MEFEVWSVERDVWRVRCGVEPGVRSNTGKCFVVQSSAGKCLVQDL